MPLHPTKLYANLDNLFTEKGFGDGHLIKEELDLGKDRNTNQFAYRGQFSPDFISNLLRYYARQTSVIFDPFVGSGTVLFEAAKKGISAFGTEINPAAYEMAKTISFVKLSPERRNKEIRLALKSVEDIPNHITNNELYDFIDTIIKSTKRPLVRSIIKNAYISLLSSKRPHTKDALVKYLQKHSQIILELPFNNLNYDAFHSDARTTPLENNVVDLIITSPPYINVFNYHQHNRVFIDRIYENTLIVAKSEFGANRKHRQNRFLTVVQYVIDMLQTFEEMNRILKRNGKAIFVVGRSSKVRGISFRNDHIITGVAMISGYELKGKQERKFTNKFGEIIYESILHFGRSGRKNQQSVPIDIARSFAQEVLKDAKRKADKATSADLEDALLKATIINPSPIYK